MRNISQHARGKSGNPLPLKFTFQGNPGSTAATTTYIRKGERIIRL